jgi:hypothetical protein
VASEIEKSLAWLESRIPNTIRWLAYPYGLSSPPAERAAEVAGLEGALAVSGGWLPTVPLNRYRLPRWNVPAGISLHGFDIRTAGYWCR